MKRIFLIATLTAATVLSACGGQTHSVTRAQSAPLSFGGYGVVDNDVPSARSSFDLLSLN